MKKDNKNGFTLVETLVAIAILLLAVAAPLSLATKSLNSSALSKQQITASFLAQEAMEFIRNVRDENVLEGGANNWLKGSSGGIKIERECVDSKCQIDAFYKEIENCSGACSPLLYNSNTGLFNTRDGSVSPYTQAVEITQINNQEIAVKVTVSWKGTNGADYKVIARENLTNWQ